MFKVIDQVMIKMIVASLKNFYGKFRYSFCFNIRTRFFGEVLLKNQMKKHKVL